MLLFKIACKNIGLFPEELMYFVLDTNSPIFRPVQIGRTSQLTRIIPPAAAQPIVRSESAPVDNMLSKPIATPKFQPKLIIQPIYLDMLPASSYPSGRPVGLIFSGSSPPPFPLMEIDDGFAALAFATFGVAFFATALAALGAALATALAAFGLAFAGFASSILSTLSSNPILSHQLYIAPIAR